jgi:putative transcriptional regulator
VSKKSTVTKASRTKPAEASDPDNPHLGAAELRAMKRVAPIKRVRWQLGLSQKDFALRFEIPIGTLRDWEQGRSNPDRPALAYLKVIGSDPEFVGIALRGEAGPKVQVSNIAAKALQNPGSLTRKEIAELAASVLSHGSNPLLRPNALKKRKLR